jgi:hypothetical protein
MFDYNGDSGDVEEELKEEAKKNDDEKTIFFVPIE